MLSPERKYPDWFADTLTGDTEGARNRKGRNTAVCKGALDEHRHLEAATGAAVAANVQQVFFCQFQQQQLPLQQAHAAALCLPHIIWQTDIISSC